MSILATKFFLTRNSHQAIRASFVACIQADFHKGSHGVMYNVMCLTSQGMASDWYFLTRAHEAALVWK